MPVSWAKFRSICKSRLSAIARSLFLSRRYWRSKASEAQQRCERLCEQNLDSQRQCEELSQKCEALQARVLELEQELAEAQAIHLPIGEPPPGLQYGEGLIALCVNLARNIGLRSTVHALCTVFKWLSVEQPIPTYQSIRGWMQRIGLDRMQSAEKIDGGVWLTDHTNQIGKEKVLTVLRVRDAPPGVPLRHENVEVLAVLPGKEWKRGNVEKAYEDLAKRYGVPRAIETDGALELREPAQTLGTPDQRPLVIRDPKHFLANQLETLLKQDPQYEAFTKQLGGARLALQQTELAHFIPPGFKVKARFMNLGPTLTWSSTMLWHLDHPESQSRQGVTESRMTEKLGWLRNFAPNIQQWHECHEVISATLKFTNENGLYRGVAARYRKEIRGLAGGPMSRQLIQKTIKFLREHERQIKPGERLPMSTEILESGFSLYKQLEKQHSKSGFTSLLLTFPTLLREVTPTEVTERFGRVKVATVKQWVKQHIPTTLAAKRLLMVREAKTGTKTAKCATPELIAA